MTPIRRPLGPGPAPALPAAPRLRPPLAAERVTAPSSPVPAAAGGAPGPPGRRPLGSRATGSAPGPPEPAADPGSTPR